MRWPVIIAVLFVLSLSLSPLPARGSVCGGGICGDGFVDPAEECDDGNLDEGDGCSALCYETFDMVTGPTLFDYSATAEHPTFVLVVDLNRDGIDDWALTTARPSYLYTYLRDASGASRQVGRYSLGGNGLYLATGELNGDHYPDLAVAERDGGSVIIFFGNGDGTMRQASVWPAPYSRSVSIGNLNFDGYDDVIVSQSDIHNFKVLYGDGQGHFPTSQDFYAGAALTSYISDLNRDGYDDVLFTSKLPVLETRMYLGSATGLSFLQGIPSPGEIGNVTSLDLNDDGYPDLVTKAGTPSVPNHATMLRSYLNQQDLTFVGNWSFDEVYEGYYWVKSDLNNDGREDLAVGIRTNYAPIYLNLGNGTFASQIRIPTPGQVNQYGPIDYNNDGTTDLIVGSFTIMKSFIIYNHNYYQFPRCGDGRIGRGENCEDGNTLDGDGCSSICQLEVSGDSDHDGLTDNEETVVYHTDPLNPDSDHDCVHDGVETCSGADPLDPSDQDGCQEIVTPTGENWRVAVTLTEASAGLKSDVYLASPVVERLIRNSLANVGRVATVAVDGGDTLTFFIRVFGQSMGLGTYDHYSDTYFARVERIDAYSYWVRFEDLPVTMADWDYNDVVLRVEFIPENPAEGIHHNFFDEYQSTKIIGAENGGTVTLTFDGFAEIHVPVGAVDENAGVVLTAGLEENYLNLDGLGANLVPGTCKKLIVTNGQPELEANANLLIAYDDLDDDGIIDNTGMTETDIKVVRFDDSTNRWVEEPTTVDAEFNTVSASVTTPALYAAGGITPPWKPPTELPVDISAPGCAVGGAGGSPMSLALALLLPLGLWAAVRMGRKRVR